ncbi:MAG: hypothetical protein BWY87_01262 [Deltaproteobacteria bacterium ADurb.Bin510]|nr:MAG: hypothetical protein BWY87_01262 [Deltaproteobacteria bacterium ADurb.Bin510]
MFGRLDQLKSVEYLRLLKGYVATGRRLLELDRAYVQEEGLRLFKTYRPALMQLLAALVCLACALVLLLMTLIVVLSIWLKPWAAGLALLVVFLVAGLIVGSRAARSLRQGLAEAKIVTNKLKEDVACFRKN